MFARFTFLLIFCLLSPLTIAQTWHSWLRDFKQEAVADGIDSNFFDHVFRGITPNRRILHFDRKQPEKRLTFKQYRKTRGGNFRITLGRREFKKRRQMLQEIGNQYGVDPCFIVAIWGMESSYGRYMGDFHVVRSLATLAYDERRAEFFRHELLLALHILNEGHVSLNKFKGEWAGASGHPQFLPSSWYKFAVDYDKDGRKDIWTTHADVFASIANYLAGNGWKTQQPWAIEVTLPAHFNHNLLGKEHEKTVNEWLKLGVHLKKQIANKTLKASIIHPNGGPDFMIFNNFRVLLRYNNSHFYAGTIGYMADRICKRL